MKFKITDINIVVKFFIEETDDSFVFEVDSKKEMEAKVRKIKKFIHPEISDKDSESLFDLLENKLQFRLLSCDVQFKSFDEVEDFNLNINDVYLLKEKKSRFEKNYKGPTELNKNYQNYLYKGGTLTEKSLIKTMEDEANKIVSENKVIYKEVYDELNKNLPLGGHKVTRKDIQDYKDSQIYEEEKLKEEQLLNQTEEELKQKLHEILKKKGMLKSPKIPKNT